MSEVKEQMRARNAAGNHVNANVHIMTDEFEARQGFEALIGLSIKHLQQREGATEYCSATEAL